MRSTIEEILEFIDESDVKFVRLVFCDLLGEEKNISIMPKELPKAFTCGISFDGSNIRGFSTIEKSDLILLPDPATLTLLPWRPQQGRVARFYCDVKNPDLSPFIFDSRSILKDTIHRCKEMGYRAKIGTECEFYLFKTDEDGNPTTQTLDQGGYLSVAPLDKGENVRRDICLCLEDMGLNVERSHHESGPGQNEIDFRYNFALEAADNFFTFKSAVKTIAAQNGLFASFMPKPLAGKSGSGLHINLSLSQGSANIFADEMAQSSQLAQKFIAGILKRIQEISILLNPTINSFDRLGEFEAPKYISWSHQNRSQLIRIPSSAKENTRLEIRSADCAVNPYLAFAAILHAGLDGIQQNLTPPQAIDKNLFEDVALQNSLSCLPQSLEEAYANFEKSQFIKDYLGQEVAEKYLFLKQEEIQRLNSAANKQEFYLTEYFTTL